MTEATLPVTPDTFIRAESDLHFGRMVADGGFGRFLHYREPGPLDHHVVFRSAQIITEDHCVPAVVSAAGPLTLRRDVIGTALCPSAQPVQ